MMYTGMKIGAAVVGGYALGRQRRAKLAITLGAWWVGKKLVLDLGHELRTAPQFEELRDQLRRELFDTDEGGVGAVLASQTNRLAESLHSRTEQLRNPAGAIDVHQRSGEDDGESTNTARTSTPDNAASEPDDEFSGETEPVPKKTRTTATPSKNRTASRSGKTRQSQRGSRSTTGSATSSTSTKGERDTSKSDTTGTGTAKGTRRSKGG